MSGDPRCLIADDHPALVSAVSTFLAEHGFEVVGPVSDGRRALALAEESKPELALVDYRMPRLFGLELVRALHDATPDTRICVYTADGDERLAAQVLGAGAYALILKEATLSELARALESVLAGNQYVDPAIAAPVEATGKLTQRELDVLARLAEGKQHEEIGRELGISAETVRTHLRKACDRLGASTRTQAVAKALRMGLIK
jgi:DNA-binding NarL/FixJ family response regulator